MITQAEVGLRWCWASGQSCLWLSHFARCKPTGCEIFSTTFVWEQCKEGKDVCCKCGLPRYCSINWLKEWGQF